MNIQLSTHPGIAARLRGGRMTWLATWLGLGLWLLPAVTSAIDIVSGKGDTGALQPRIYDFGDGPVFVYKMMMAGDPNHLDADTPGDRVDPNLSSSPFRGVGSLRIFSDPLTYICSGTTLTSRHLVTAAHCFDLDDDGTSDVAPSDVTYFLNDGSDLSVSRLASNITIHPQFTGFANPRVNDDVAVVTLASPLPAGSKTYPLRSTTVFPENTLTLVGYGRSGDGISGDTIDPSFKVKRSGQNIADSFLTNDEPPFPLTEVYRFDFDFPPGSGSGSNFRPSLGNRIETTIAGGDSGGAAFVDNNGVLELAGVNTYSFNAATQPPPPLFGSGAGGMLITAYRGWILEQIPEPGSAALALCGSLIWSWLGYPRGTSCGGAIPP